MGELITKLAEEHSSSCDDKSMTVCTWPTSPEATSAFLCLSISKMLVRHHAQPVDAGAISGWTISLGDTLKVDLFKKKGGGDAGGKGEGGGRL